MVKHTKKNPAISISLLPMRETIVFPGTSSPFYIGRPQSLEALDFALKNDRRLFAVAQKTSSDEMPGESDLYRVGTVGRVIQVMKMPNRTVKILFEAEYRAEIIDTDFSSECPMAFVRELDPEIAQNDQNKIDSLLKILRNALYKYFKKNNRNKELIKNIEQDDLLPDEVVDRIAPLLDNIEIEKKQSLLETVNTVKRLENLYQWMIEDEENKKLESRIKQRIQNQIGKSHREFYLNEQMKAIQKELGNEDGKAEINEFEEKIKNTDLSAEANDVVQKEIKRLQLLPPYSSEANIVRNYIDWLLAVPWQHFTKDEFNLSNAQKILDEDHYGLEKVKERIIEFLAVSKNIGEIKGPIICLVGPPGVGKTSLAKSVARCLNRNFARISLGGLRDEAEIRGHRRTYIGAMPGKIIQVMKKSKTSNPLILLDEIDKMSHSHMGDPAAALLEVLDPEQNHTFMDHFLEVEYDLSKVLFFCTANSVQDIPSPLLDRMELIAISGYTEPEKVEIAKRHLIPKQLKENGLSKTGLKFREESLFGILRHYTRESGIRSFERAIGKVCRKAVTELEKNSERKSITATPKKIREYLGVEQYSFGMHNEKNEVGLATGLAWTSFGGDVLFIEVTEMSGKGGIHLTGKLGDVMKESAKTALSYIRSNANKLGIYSSVFQNRDIHVHVPEGATPKDGPSAGITLAVALVSLLTSIPVKRDIAMTGEITLRGNVLKIGGLKEKMLAAKRAGIKSIIIPKENEGQPDEFSKEILDNMTVYPVSHVSEVFKLALETLPKSVSDSDLEDKKNPPPQPFTGQQDVDIKKSPVSTLDI